MLEEEETPSFSVEDDNMDTSWADQEDEMIEKEPMSDIMCWLLYLSLIHI